MIILIDEEKVFQNIYNILMIFKGAKQIVQSKFGADELSSLVNTAYQPQVANIQDR